MVGIGAGFSSQGSGTVSCRDTIHLICLYLEGKLSPGVASEIQQHLEHCGDCRLVMDAAMNTLDRFFNQEPVATTPTSTRAA
jgi:predicted anti-sigma-YlaC factor YlaD